MKGELLLVFCLLLSMEFQAINFKYVTGLKILDDLISALFPTKCFKNIGCFNSGPPFWSLLSRPITRLPEDHFKTDYLLYSRLSSDNPYNISLNNESVAQSPFNASLPTKVLIPGFEASVKPDNTIFEIKDEILKEGSYNVIIIDWSSGNSFPYVQAIANGRKVGASLAFLLTIIQKNKGIDFEDVHLIGHSLGAHIAGWAGERLKNLGRISGLDPAGPFFRNAPKPVRLDKTDAIFVDIIHTDGAWTILGGFGLKENIGHLDFYPNGGSNQPGCKKKKKAPNLLGIKSNLCQHAVSKEYFLFSILECRFLAVQCKNYNDFKKGKCTNKNSQLARMGYHAKKIKDIKGEPKFYLYTAEKSPYCIANNTSNDTIVR